MTWREKICFGKLYHKRFENHSLNTVSEIRWIEFWINRVSYFALQFILIV